MKRVVNPKNQHFVPECVLKQWKEKSKDPKDPRSKLSFFDVDGKVKTINYGDNLKYFSSYYHFEFYKDDPQGNIERKLSKLESEYSNFAQKIIENESLIKREQGTQITKAEKSVIFTFVKVQQHRVNMPPDTKCIRRIKKLNKIEAILDAYFKFKKMSEKELIKTLDIVNKEYGAMCAKFKHNYKEFSVAFLAMIDDPLKDLIFHVMHESYVMGMKYFEKKYWPLPVSGCFQYALGIDEFGINFTFVPLTPRTVLAFVWSPKTQREMDVIKKRFSQSFGEETLFSTIWDMTAYCFKHSKVPIVIPESWSKSLEIKQYSEEVSIEQKKLEIKYKNNALKINKKIEESNL